MPDTAGMEKPLHTVVETPAFLAGAEKAGMTDAERTAAVNQIAADPTAGDRIVGSGGCRKVRVAGRGFGKSGGFRVVTAYLNARLPVFLIAVLSKGRAANFTREQVKAMKGMMDRLRAGS
jgi:hypothetical protein